MKKFIFLFICLILTACAEKQQSVLSKNDLELTINDIEQQEYLYSDLEDVCNRFWKELTSQVLKLNDAELYGTSENKYDRKLHNFNVFNEYADEIIKDFEIHQGQKIIVNGYLGDVVELADDNFFVRQGVGKIGFNLKSSEDDTNIIGILCRSDDESFLKLKENTPIKIEGAFMKSGAVTGSGESLFDCTIVKEQQ